jgi:hypothetical protein
VGMPAGRPIHLTQHRKVPLGRFEDGKDLKDSEGRIIPRIVKYSEYWVTCPTGLELSRKLCPEMADIYASSSGHEISSRLIFA